MRSRPKCNIFQLFRACNFRRFAHPKRALSPVDFHSRDYGIEIQRWRNTVVQLYFANLIVLAEILVHSLQHSLELLLRELHPGNTRRRPQHLLADALRSFLLNFRPQNARQKRGTQPQARKVSKKRASIARTSRHKTSGGFFAREYTRKL